MPDAVVAALLAEAGTEDGTRFGPMSGVKVDGKIAAMLLDGRLMVKLPADRCHELIASGTAKPLQMRTRTMREWVSVEPDSDGWPALGREALAFVRAANARHR